MKAKYYIGILSVLLLTISTVNAQIADMRDYRNDDARIVVNNYYDDYDYYFSSRINRFHRSYSTFDYYAPVFTDSYWYNYRPYSWGISIYGGDGFGFGYSFNYPFYNYDYGYNYGGYDSYFGSSYYWGYNPFFYNNWYTPVIFNVRIRNRWSNNYYGWNRHNHRFNDYRPGYNTYNNYNYPSTRYSSSGYSSGRRVDNFSESSSGNVSRRVVSTGNSSRNAVVRSISTGKSNNDQNMGESRRITTTSRSVSTPARSSSSSRSGTSASQGRSTSSRTESKSASSSSSSSKEKSTRRK